MTFESSLGLLVACTAALTLLLAPVAYRVLHTHNMLDVPNHRSSHEQPTVRGGGVACALGLTLAWPVASGAGMDMPGLSLLAALVMACVGLADDVWGLPAPWRLVAQVTVGVALGAALGGPAAAVLGGFAFPVAVNAVNFMDGVNGITSLTVAAWATVVLAAGTGATGLGTAIIAALALGQALGFLPWNLPRARMFLGDSGSYLFGGLIAAGLVQSQSAGGSPGLLLTPLVVYLFDTGYTLSRRAFRGAPVFSAHREHLYQRMGVLHHWSHTRVAGLVALLSLLIGLLWVVVTPVLAGVGTVVSLGAYLRLATTSRLPLPVRREG